MNRRIPWVLLLAGIVLGCCVLNFYQTTMLNHPRPINPLPIRWNSAWTWSNC